MVRSLAVCGCYEMAATFGIFEVSMKGIWIFYQSSLKLGAFKNSFIIGHFRNVRGLGKSMVVFRLFEKLKYSNERSTIF